MKRVKIYLRSIIDQDNEKKLALFDSERNGGINNLTTTVEAGGTVIWKPDSKSGLKDVARIIAKGNKEGLIFKSKPSRRFLCKGIKLKIPKDARGEEDYGIEYVLCDGTKLNIDPRIKIYPPPP